MIRQRIYRIHAIDVVDRLTMTTERILLSLDRWVRVKVFDSDPAFDGAGCPALRRIKRLAVKRLEDVGELTLAIHHARHTSRHEFQRTLSFLRRSLHLPDIVDVDIAMRHGDDE